jgi:hypothetical protein
MVTELQFVAVAVFLIWGLVASLCGVLTTEPDAARLVWRDRDSKPEAPTSELDQAAFVSDQAAVALPNSPIGPSPGAHATQPPGSGLREIRACERRRARTCL